MSTIPTIPIIYSKPIRYDQTMELYWRSPSSDGGSNIMGYVIENVNNPNQNFFVSSETRNYKIFNLNNDQTYIYSIKAYNEIGNSNVAIFDSAIPGATPVIPTNFDFSVNANANASFSWMNGIGGYRPTDIDGLALWLDLADTYTTTVSGNNLIGITDKSSYQNQITVNNTRPTYNANLLNGKPGITFNGNSWLRGRFFNSNITPTLADKFLVAGGSFNGTSGNTIVYSNDNGVTWIPSPNCNTIFNESCNSVAYNGKRWVAGGKGLNSLAYSDDGINWYRSGNGNTLFDFVNAVVWGNGMWIAGGYGQVQVAYSYDGIEWIPSTSGNSIFSGGCSNLAFGNSLFIASASVGFYNLTYKLAYSRDGINWIQTTASNMTDITDIEYNKSLNQWMICGTLIDPENSNTNDITIVKTVDPLVQYYKVRCPNPSPGSGFALITVGYNPYSWNVVSISLKNLYLPSSDYIPVQINAGNLTSEIELENAGYRIVIYLYSAPFYPSDAIGTSRSFTIKWWNPGNTIIFDPGARNFTRINITPYAGAANYSYDGISWSSSSVSTILNNTAYKVFFGGGYWVMSGSGSNLGKIIYSTDGINFTEATSASGITKASGGVIYNGYKWFAVGSDSNYMMSSIDGISWSAITGISNTFNDSVRCIASKNILPFDNKYTTDSNGTVFYNYNQYTVFVVGSMNTNVIASGRLVSFSDSTSLAIDTTNNKAIPIINYAGSTAIASYKDGNWRAAVGTSLSAAPGIYTSTYNGTQFNIYNNGTVSSGSYANKMFINTFGIGYQASYETLNSSDYWNGNLFECLIYFGALNSLQRQYIEGYLAWKWGLQTNLNADHIYRLNNPTLLNNIFTPNIVPNCQLWLDASSQNNFTLSNGNVSVWLDRSTNANHFNGNGQRLLNFNLSQKMINFPTGNVGFMNSIGNFNYTQGSTQLMIVAQGNSGTIFSTQYKVLSFGNGVLTGSPGNSGNEAEYSGNGVSTNTHRYNVTSSTYSNFYLLNAAAGTNWGGTPTNTTAYIGYKGGYNESSPFTGNICEIIAYSSLNTENLTLLQGYLSWKWGLNNVIPISHSYTSFNPNNYEGYEIIPKIRNMVTLIPYDNSGNIINQANLKIYGSTYVNVTNRNMRINNTNYSYRGIIQSISNVGYSTPVYTEKFHPNVVTNGLSLWLDPYDISTLTTSNGLVTRWADKSKNKANASATLLTTRSLIPSDISGLRLWIDAQDSSNITLSANSNIVASITDKSPNRYIFSGASGFTYNETKFNTTFPSFYNSNISSGNNLGANTTITLNQPLTVFYVGSYNTTFTDGYLHDSTTSTNRIAFHQDTGEFFGGNSVFGAAGVIVKNFVISGYFNTTNTAGYINGDINPYASGNGGTNNGTSLLLGNRYSLTNAWDGHICEILMYNGELSLRNRRRIEGYLAQKWGLISSLPNYHPFKSIIPLHPEPITPIYDSANGYITFNGSEYLTLPNSTIPSGNSDYTMFLYLNTKAITETQWTLFSGQQTANLALGSFINTSNVVQSWWTNNLTGNVSLSNNVGFLTGYTYSSNVRSMYINGTLIGMDNVSVRNSNIANNIIGNNNSFDIGLLGKIGDIVVYNRLLPTHERKAVENYILSRRLFSIFYVPNIQLWLDASDPYNNLTKPSNGSTVSIWYDKSGNQNNGIQYLTNGIPTYNSTSNSISFNNQMYVLTNPIAQIGTIFIVGKKFTSNGNTLTGRSSDNNGYSPYYIAIKSDVSLTVSKTDNSLVNYQVLPSSFNQTTLFTGIITSSSVSAILNGGINTVSQNYTGTLKIATETYIGASWYGNVISIPTSSDINEIIIFNRALSIDERYKVEGYLAWKWSITNNLPNDHPYKNTIPTI